MCIWNKGNANSFPLLVLEEKKNPVGFLVFVSFALARENSHDKEINSPRRPRSTSLIILLSFLC